MSNASKTNVEKGEKGTLNSVSYTWLKNEENEVTASDCHPVSENPVSLALSDRFHEGNSKNLKELLRRVRLKQLLSSDLFFRISYYYWDMTVVAKPEIDINSVSSSELPNVANIEEFVGKGIGLNKSDLNEVKL